MSPLYGTWTEQTWRYDAGSDAFGAPSRTLSDEQDHRPEIVGYAVHDGDRTMAVCLESGALYVKPLRDLRDVSGRAHLGTRAEQGLRRPPAPSYPVVDEKPSRPKE